MLTALLLVSLGNAGTLEATVDAARDAIIAGDLPLAAGYLRSAEGYGPHAAAVIEGEELARIWLYRGMIVHMSGGGQDQSMDLWRQALVVSVEVPWDEQALVDRDAQDLFEALRQEIRDRPQIDAWVPAAVGAAKLYVDGERVRAGDAVREGVHLAQIACPDEQGVFGQWTSFEKDPKWLKLCPDGVDTTVAVAEEEEDEFGEFGLSFGSAGASTDEPATPLPPTAESARVKVSVPLLVGAGGAALISGGMYLAALSSRAQFDDVTSPSIQTIDDVSAMQQQTNTRVYLSAGSGAVALGLYAAAFLDLRF